MNTLILLLIAIPSALTVRAVYHGLHLQDVLAIARIAIIGVVLAAAAGTAIGAYSAVQDYHAHRAELMTGF